MYVFWSLHATFCKKILHLVSYQMLNFRPLLDLNLFLGGYMPALPMKILHFGDLKMLNFWPYFSLNMMS